MRKETPAEAIAAVREFVLESKYHAVRLEYLEYLEDLCHWQYGRQIRQIENGDAKLDLGMTPNEFHKFKTRSTDLEIKMRRYIKDVMEHRELEAIKVGYNPSQLRVPAGNSNGGQWTDGNGGYGRATGGARKNPYARPVAGSVSKIPVVSRDALVSLAYKIVKY